MSHSILSLKDVSLSHRSKAGEITILKNISFDVPESQSVGLIGPSGSGKSSLLMLLGGLEKATGGQIYADGKNITNLSEDALAQFRRHTMGIVFQSFHLIPTMTALENVATPLELRGDKNAFDKAADMLNTVGLGHRKTHRPAQMSGGEQQRVALARAAVTRPRVLLADEPTGNLDGPNGTAIMDLLFNLRDEFGSTLILVTHAPELAQRCDRVIQLLDGQIVQDEVQ